MTTRDDHFAILASIKTLSRSRNGRLGRTGEDDAADLSRIGRWIRPAATSPNNDFNIQVDQVVSTEYAPDGPGAGRTPRFRPSKSSRSP